MLSKHLGVLLHSSSHGRQLLEVKGIIGREWLADHQARFDMRLQQDRTVCDAQR